MHARMCGKMSKVAYNALPCAVKQLQERLADIVLQNGANTFV
jgi:hypothetical protein